jgi:hypothetical protein
MSVVALSAASTPALDLDDARRRLAAAAEEAKRLEAQGAGFAALEAWKRYELIANAIGAQERRRGVAQRLRTPAP